MGPESLGTPPWNSEQSGPITKPQGRAAQASTTSHLLARAAWSRHAECWVDGSARVGEGRRGHASDATRGTPQWPATAAQVSGLAGALGLRLPAAYI